MSPTTKCAKLSTLAAAPKEEPLPELRPTGDGFSREAFLQWLPTAMDLAPYWGVAKAYGLATNDAPEDF